MQAGDYFAEKYLIEKILGKGGMGTVYLARNTRTGMFWAVKEISRETGTDAVMPSEPDLLNRLDHPALPRLYDIVEQDGKLYMITDYIDGISLDKKLEAEGRIAEDTITDWAIQLCLVLDYLHSMKPNPIIYRDIKPSNIMLTENGTLKLIDFGTAREYKPHSDADTVYIGTRGYAAPEQFGTGQTSAASDIYSLGVTLHHLVTGKSPIEPPFRIEPIRRYDESLSPELEAIISKCTCESPSDRYQSAAELLSDLSAFRDRKGAVQQQKLHITQELNVFQIPGSPVHPDRPSESYEPVGSCKPVQSFGTAQSFRTVQSYDPVQTYGPVHRGAPADSRENGHDGGLPERAKAGTGPRNDGSTMYNASNALHNTVSRNYVNIPGHTDIPNYVNIPDHTDNPNYVNIPGHTDIRNETNVPDEVNIPNDVDMKNTPPVYSFRRKVITVWDNAEFGCEFAYTAAKLTGSEVLLADLDLLAPKADLILNVNKYPPQLARNDMPGHSGLDVVMDAADKKILTSALLKQAAAVRKDMKNLYIITGNYRLDNYEYYSEDSVTYLIDKCYRHFDITVLLVNRSIYDAFTLAALLRSDVNIAAVKGEIGQLREYNAYIAFLSEKQQLPPDNTKFVLFEHDGSAAMSEGEVFQATQGNLLGAVSYSRKRVLYRNMNSAYACHMEKEILRDYSRIHKKLGFLPSEGFVPRLRMLESLAAGMRKRKNKPMEGL